MATKRRKSRKARARRNPVRYASNKPARRSRRRSYARRNPPVASQVTQALRDAAVGAVAQMVAGKVAAMLPNFVDSPASGGAGKWGPQINAFLAGAAVGVAARMVAGADVGRAAIQGALQAPLVGAVNVAAPGLLGAYVQPRTLAAYVTPRATLAAYPTAPRLLAGDPTSPGTAAVSGAM